MKNFVQFFHGAGGGKSSKRLFLCFLLILFGIYFFANLFGGRELKATLEENLFYLIGLFYAGVYCEKLMDRVGKPTVKKTPDPKPEA